MDEGNHFEIYNLAIHPFRGILLKVDEVNPVQMRLFFVSKICSKKKGGSPFSAKNFEGAFFTRLISETFLRNRR